MPFKPLVAVYDACVLYPFHLRNLLIQCAVDRLVEARWTDDIHDEWIRSLAAVSGVPSTRLQATRDLMKAILPNADVRDHHRQVVDIVLPDPDDRHVVAAAIASHATVIVTWNIKDFPATELDRHGLTASDPDAFLVNLHYAAPNAFLAAVANARRNLRKTSPTAQGFVEALSRQNLIRVAELLRGHLESL